MQLNKGKAFWNNNEPDSKDLLVSNLILFFTIKNGEKFSPRG
jgi:hypothetical protein